MRLNRLSAASLTLAMSLSAAAGASVSNDTLQADARATTVDHRDETVVAYTALEKDGWIFVKVEHRPTWHTYAMDNLLRAQERSGNEEPEAELPTVIHLDGAASSEGWLQSEPKDLSQPELRWYTWGFEDTSWFARRAEGDVEQLVIDAQACTADRCAMVEELAVPVLPAESGDLPDIEGLEPVRSAAGESAAEESAALPVLEGEALLDKEGKRFNDDDIFDVVTYRQLDGDCDGKVSMAELVKVTRSSSEYPRSLNWLVNFDADEDGFVAPGELAAGLRKNRERQIKRLMDVDADGNGEVTMQEHALSYAFREGREKAEEQGQKKWFNDLDADSNGTIGELAEAVVVNHLLRDDRAVAVGVEIVEPLRLTLLLSLFATLAEGVAQSVLLQGDHAVA
ncbi:MAG: hypothetical protein AAGA81_06315, partial [Acidobacteriota bacterium]